VQFDWRIRVTRAREWLERDEGQRRWNVRICLRAQRRLERKGSYSQTGARQSGRTEKFGGQAVRKLPYHPINMVGVLCSFRSAWDVERSIFASYSNKRALIKECALVPRSPIRLPRGVRETTLQHIARLHRTERNGVGRTKNRADSRSAAVEMCIK
jgi:hypothetical protein